MLIHPWDATLGPEEWQDWLAATDRFGMLAVGNLDPALAPVVLPLHFTVAGDELLIHLARPNPVWPHLEAAAEVRLAMIGDYAYIPGLRSPGTLVSDRRALTALAEAGLRSAGCIAGDMTPTVNTETDQGQGGRIDHILLSPMLACAVVPESYQVHVSDAGNKASDHRMVSVRLDLTRVRFSTMRVSS